MRKYLFASVVVLVLTLISACGGSGGGAPSSGGSILQGEDFTGTWRVSGVACTNAAGATTSIYTLAAGSSTYEWGINGNTSTETFFNSSSCRTNLTKSIVFTETADIGNVAAGNTAWGSGNASITTGQGSCTYTYNLTKSAGATITPTTLTITYNNGQASGSSNGNYIYAKTTVPPGLMIPTIIQVVGSPSDVCYLVYDYVN